MRKQPLQLHKTGTHKSVPSEDVIPLVDSCKLAEGTYLSM